MLLALPLRKDFHPLRGKMSRSAFKIIPHKKAAAQNPVNRSLSSRQMKKTKSFLQDFRDEILVFFYAASSKLR